jgi:serine/arginine repetitive matrix protein 2
MYNGIGLATVRGSATSGHVTKNLSYVKPEFFRKKVGDNANIGQFQQQRFDRSSRGKESGRPTADKDILAHNRKRELEAKIFELREEMTEQGYSEEEIQARVDKLTSSSSSSRLGSGTGAATSLDTHELVARKNEENARLARAFGVADNGISSILFYVLYFCIVFYTCITLV